MIKPVLLALVAGGIILLALGINSYNSTSSDISRFFTGSATDKSMWMLIGGTVMTVAGAAGFLRGSKSLP